MDCSYIKSKKEMWYASIMLLMNKKVNAKRIASEKVVPTESKKIKRLLLRTIPFWPFRRDSNPNRSLRRRLRYPVTLRKDFYILKVISRYKIYQFYTTILHVLNEKHDMLWRICYAILYLGIAHP